MNLTKYVLKHPVTTALAVLCLIVFGISSLMGMPLELMSEINMPMMVVSTVYPGASPDDVSELVTKPIEDEVGTLSGIKDVTSVSNENMSLVVLQYEYGTDMDDSYTDLRKAMDSLLPSLPDDVQDPSIMEFDMNAQAAISLSVNNASVSNLYNYVTNDIVPELEKLSSVASVDVSGGRSQYIKVELIPEKLSQYHLNMSAISSAISSASFTYPAGDTRMGSQSLSVTTSVDYDTMDRLKEIPIGTGNGNLIYLEDVAHIYYALDEASGIGRYNGEDTVTLSVQKQQSETAVQVSKDVMKTLENLQANDPDLQVTVIQDSSDMINSSLESVYQTMIMAVVISMVIIFLFFGEIKASLIVGTSIPFSILLSLILMSLMDFSLNVITLSAIVLGVGMMVDNSIVVLESCFRATKGKKGFLEYTQAALEGTNIVVSSIIGSTITTCVVFLPLAMLSGMSGQLFKPLGFTIVFCMVSSLISAMTIVPLCYTMYRPKEKDSAPLSEPVARLQDAYRKLMVKILPRKKTVMFTTLGLLALSFLMASQLDFEMIPANDEGTLSVEIEVRPGLDVAAVDEVLKQVEEYVTADPNLDSYMLSYGGSGVSLSSGSSATLTAYLKDNRTMKTDQVARLWQPELRQLTDCNITVTESSTVSSMTGSSDSGQVEYILQSVQYDELKEAADAIVADMTARDDVTRVHSTLENAAPLVKIDVDPIKAAAEGLAPVQIASAVNQMLSGVTATTLEVDGEEMDVNVEFADDEYADIDQLKGIVLTTQTGAGVALMDVADVVFEDSPQSITRENKQYQVTITGDITESGDEKTSTLVYNESVKPHMTANISRAQNTVDEMMYEEFSALFQAIAIAVFLVFVVMAAQFESPKFSIMVMTTIPFSLIGSFGLLYLADVSISMPSLLGFLMLVGTVVNNGILYVDTVNQYRATMDRDTALIEAGATRLRPILMTTLTTVVSMIPMAMAFGDSGETMQGLALVNVGGLLASTILALLMLPVYYSVLNRKPKPEPAID